MKIESYGITRVYLSKMAETISVFITDKMILQENLKINCIFEEFEKMKIDNYEEFLKQCKISMKNKRVFL